MSSWIDRVGSGRLTPAEIGRFTPGGKLAQHVTSSINLGAYPSPARTRASMMTEKLQPPLHDPTNNELRILVEHRGTDGLPEALNQVPAGKQLDVWDRSSGGPRDGQGRAALAARAA